MAIVEAREPAKYNEEKEPITYVLVHGAFQGGWVWERMLPMIGSSRIFCPTLSVSAEGLQDHIHQVCDIIDENALSNVILVGHSYGGIVVGGVANERADKINMLVYLDAPIPIDGKSLLDILGEDTAAYFHKLAYEDGGVWYVPSFPAAAFGITKEEDICWTETLHTAQPLKTFTDPVLISEKDSIATVYIQCLPGNDFTTKQARIATEKGWRLLQIDSLHCPMITNPKALAELFGTMLQTRGISKER